MGVLGKNRPQSANLKKKQGKSAERLKKSGFNRQRVQEEADSIVKYTSQQIPAFNKDVLVSQSLIESHITNDGSSFDRDEIFRHKLMKKNLGIAKKGEVKLQMSSLNKNIISKKTGNKFMMYKRPEPTTVNKPITYDQLNYIDPSYKFHNMSVDGSLFRKSSYQLDKKRKAKVITTQKQNKNKQKRSATPSLLAPQQMIVQNFNANNILKKKNMLKISKTKVGGGHYLNENIASMLM